MQLIYFDRQYAGIIHARGCSLVVAELEYSVDHGFEDANDAGWTTILPKHKIQLFLQWTRLTMWWMELMYDLSHRKSCDWRSPCWELITEWILLRLLIKLTHDRTKFLSGSNYGHFSEFHSSYPDFCETLFKYCQVLWSHKLGLQLLVPQPFRGRMRMITLASLWPHEINLKIYAEASLADKVHTFGFSVCHGELCRGGDRLPLPHGWHCFSWNSGNWKVLLYSWGDGEDCQMTIEFSSLGRIIGQI